MNQRIKIVVWDTIGNTLLGVRPWESWSPAIKEWMLCEDASGEQRAPACSRGVRVTGTDAWSWDAPFSHTAKRWAETRDPSIIWEGHKAGRIRPYYQIEKLTNLEALPSHGFTVSCFPIKIERASAGWIRAVALID